MRRKIKTTVNLDYAVFLRFQSAAKTHCLCPHELVHVLLMFLRTEAPVEVKSFQQLRYQERIPERVWKRMHVTLGEASYETCMDLRKLYKFSVSGLLSLAIELFLERAIGFVKGGEWDKYSPIYTFLQNITTDSPYYMIFYSFPPEEIQRFHDFQKENTA